MAKKLGQASALFESKVQSSEVTDMINDLMEKYGVQEGSIRDLSSDEEKLEMLPTHVPSLDVALKGGIPARTIVELYGESGGGKSWLAQKIAASATYEGWRTFFVDAELAFNPFRAQDIGMDLNLVTYFDGVDNGEQCMAMVSGLLNNPNWDRSYNQPKPYKVIVIDSIAAMPTKSDMEADLVNADNRKDAPKIRVAAKATMMSQTLKKMQPSLAHSPGVYSSGSDERTFARYHNEVFPLDKASMPDDIRKELQKLAKIRAPYGYNLFKPEVQEQIGDIPPDVIEYEKMLTGQVVEVRDGGLVTMHYNPGPIIVVVNQTRFADFESWGGAKKKTTGGQALLFFAGTRINIEPVTGTVKKRIKGPDGKMMDAYVPKGELRHPVTDEVTHYLSQGRIIKSRYTQKAVNIQIKIPVGETQDDVFDEFRSTMKEKGLYEFSRGSHKVFPAIGEQPVIKTKDNDEFLEQMLETGIDLMQEKLSLSDDQVELLKVYCEERLSREEEGIDSSDDDEYEEDE